MSRSNQREFNVSTERELLLSAEVIGLPELLRKIEYIIYDF